MNLLRGRGQKRRSGGLLPQQGPRAEPRWGSGALSQKPETHAEYEQSHRSSQIPCCSESDYTLKQFPATTGDMHPYPVLATPLCIIIITAMICLFAAGSRVIQSSKSRRRRQGLRPVVRSNHLPVPLRQLYRTLPARVPDRTGGGRGSRELGTAGQPRPEQRSESGILAQTHHPAGVRHRGRQDVLLQRS